MGLVPGFVSNPPGAGGQLLSVLRDIPPTRPAVELSDQPFTHHGTTGQACLLVHGFTGTPSDVAQLGRYLHECGHTVHAPALPGHAQRPVQLRGVHWTDCYARVHQAWRRLAAEYERVHVVGFSFGGTLALHLAANEPVDGLALLAPGVFVRIRARDIVGGFLGLIPGTWLHERLRWHLMLLRVFRMVRGELARVRCPLLVLHARDDLLVQSRGALWVYDHVSSPDRRLVYLRDGGHLLPWGPAYPEVWNELSAWLGRQTAVGAV